MRLGLDVVDQVGGHIASGVASGDTRHSHTFPGVIAIAAGRTLCGCAGHGLWVKRRMLGNLIVACGRWEGKAC